jgi:hypothetical protein
LQLYGPENNSGDSYVPAKMIIRKKGMVWISECENYQELVSSLMAEITQFRPEVER